MKTRNSIFTFLIATFITVSAFGQDKKIDNLEQLYAQEHYKMVYARSGKLMDKPDYDFTEVPKFYRSISTFHLAQNKYWLKRNKNALAKAEKMFVEIKQGENSKKILTTHKMEVAALQDEITEWIGELSQQGQTEMAKKVQGIQNRIFSNVPKTEKKDTKPVNRPIIQTTKERSEIIAFAEKSIGVPYVWGGTTPNGFDCSGYTTYVMKEFGITMPRRATDQQKASARIKQKDVQPGDLVFFNNGSGISHVGIIVSEQGQPLTMIHASSSKGIIITNLETSSYWKKRLDSFGTYLN